MLKIKSLKSGYDKMQVLKGVDLDVGKGEIVAIIGSNGAGKSTVFKSIFNLCDIYSGVITLNNKNILKLPTYKLIGEGITYVSQGRQIFSTLTVKENLLMGAYMLKDTFLIRTRLAEIFKMFPFLKNKVGSLASTLSGGQQQLLAIGRALMQNPKVLLLDEPSLGLSPKMVKEVFKKIVEINQSGVAIMIVEQNVKQAVAIAHKIYVLEEGKIIYSGGKEILNNEKIRNIYFGGR